MRTKAPDPHALAVAQAVQEKVAPATVILFGSRARGDYRENSVIDLLIITGNDSPPQAGRLAYHAANQYMETHPPELEVEAIDMTREDFDRCRLAKQHIAGQADTYGVIMGGENLDYQAGCEDPYPAHWPETRRRIENAETWLRELNEMVDDDHWNQKLIGFAAQQSVENALEGWLSAHKDEGSYRHNLSRAWGAIDRREDWSSPETDRVRESVSELFEKIAWENPDRRNEQSDWLSQYAAVYRYGETHFNMTRQEKLELQIYVSAAIEDIIERIHALSGTAEADVYPDGIKPWDIGRE